MGDFRTAQQERKILSRISYLESLLLSTPETDLEERQELEHEIARTRESYEEIHGAPLAHVPAFETLPQPPSPAEPKQHLSDLTLSQWKKEAQLRVISHGDHDDEPRRIVLLIQEIETLREELKTVNAMHSLETSNEDR